MICGERERAIGQTDRNTRIKCYPSVLSKVPVIEFALRKAEEENNRKKTGNGNLFQYFNGKKQFIL